MRRSTRGVSYTVFARKYRPQKFEDVLGQEHITKTLRNAIDQNRIAHAYIFVGPRGTGKTSTARIFAMALNSTNGPKADFDPEDDICKEIAQGRSLDDGHPGERLRAQRGGSEADAGERQHEGTVPEVRMDGSSHGNLA